MEFLLSIAGVSTILVLVFWLFAIPFIYPKYIANFITNIVPKTYLFIFWSFFSFYFFMGIVLILKGYSAFGLVLILFLTIGYGFIQYLKSKRVLINGIFSFVLDIAYGSVHQIIVYLFIAGMLFYSIYLFYFKSIINGAIIGYFVIAHLIATSIGLWWYTNKKNKSKPKIIKDLEKPNPDSENLSLKQVLEDFEPDISKSIYQLTNELNNILSILAEFVYADYIPEKLRTGNNLQTTLSLKDYVLTENSIPEEEKAVIQNIIQKRKEIYEWKSNFNISVHIQSYKLSNNKKEVEKKIATKTKKSENKPPKSAGK